MHAISFQVWLKKQRYLNLVVRFFSASLLLPPPLSSVTSSRRCRRFISTGSLSGIMEPLSPDPLLALHVNICHSQRAEVHRFPSFGKQTYYYNPPPDRWWGGRSVACLVCKSRWVHPRVMLLHNCGKWFENCHIGSDMKRMWYIVRLFFFFTPNIHFGSLFLNSPNLLRAKRFQVSHQKTKRNGKKCIYSRLIGWNKEGNDANY